MIPLSEADAHQVLTALIVSHPRILHCGILQSFDKNTLVLMVADNFVVDKNDKNAMLERPTQTLRERIIVADPSLKEKLKSINVQVLAWDRQKYRRIKKIWTEQESLRDDEFPPPAPYLLFGDDYEKNEIQCKSSKASSKKSSSNKGGKKSGGEKTQSTEDNLGDFIVDGSVCDDNCQLPDESDDDYQSSDESECSFVTEPANRRQKESVDYSKMADWSDGDFDDDESDSVSNYSSITLASDDEEWKKGLAL